MNKKFNYLQLLRAFNLRFSTYIIAGLIMAGLLSASSVTRVSAQATAGVYDSYITLGGNEYYLGTSSSPLPAGLTTNALGKPKLQDINLGSFSSTASLVISNGMAYTWRGGNGNAGNICGGADFNYAVYQSGNTPGFANFQLSSNPGSGNIGTSYWQEWDANGSPNVNILAGLSPGKYYFAVYINVTGDLTNTNNCNTNIPVNGLPDTTAGAYYIATFTIKGLSCPPGPATGTQLITNGYFTGGTTGFNTGYTYTNAPTAGNNSEPGDYFIGTAAEAKTFNANFTISGSPGGANDSFMVVDGNSSASPYTYLNVWSETINTLSPNTVYIFSFYVASMDATSPAHIYALANDTAFGGEAVAPGTPGNWNKVIKSWCSGSHTSITITIIDSNQTKVGNDFAIDSISLRSSTGYSNISAGNDTTICNGNTVTLNPTSGACSYTWKPSATLNNDSIQSPVASPTITTTYTLIAVVPGCTNDTLPATSVIVTVGSNIPVSAGRDTTLCSGSGTVLQGSGGTTYSWSPATGLSSSTVAHPTATPTTSTTYTLIATTTGGCSGTATVAVSIGGTIPVNAGNPASVCSGHGTVLQGTGGGTYSWSPTTGLSNPTTANPTATPTITTTYTLTVTNGGCTGTNSVVISVGNFTPSVVPSDTSLCGNHPVQLSISTLTTSVSWSPTTGLSNPDIANPVASPTTSTTYTATISNSGGCTATASVAVTVNPGYKSGQVLANPDTICPSTIASLTLAGNSAGAIQWQSSANSTTGFTSISGASKTSYTTGIVKNSTFYRVVVGTGACAETSPSFEIYVIAPPSTNFSARADGHVVTFAPVSSIGVTSYSWNFGDGSPLSSTENPVHTYDTAGTYDVCLTVGNNSNCNFINCQNVTAYPTGINNIANDNTWLVYPDPFGATLYISTGSATVRAQRIEVFDVLGRRVYLATDVMQNPVQIDLTGLVTGAYFVRITTPQGDFVRKVIKE